MGEGESEGEVLVAVLDDGGMKNENSSRIESKRDHEWLGDDTEVEPCTKKQAKEASSDTELESCANKYELESSCTKKQAKDALSDTELESWANKHELDSSYTKKHAKDSISDTELESANNENSSTCSGNSSSWESLNEEEKSKNDTSGAVSTSLFVREIPKDFNFTGIRKITFKFSKCKKDYDNQLSVTAVGSTSDRISQWNHSASDDMNTEISSYGKVLPDSYPTTVKKLLSIEILEGARVKYVTTSQERELPGIIKGCGYLCGCSLCNFSKVNTECEFELHAGGKTRHPNNHIYLENGKPIYKSLQENSHMVKTEKRCHISVPGMHHATTRPSFYHSSLVMKQKKIAKDCTKKRDNDLHRLLFMPNGLLDGAELAYYSKEHRILGAYKQGIGIVCSCCHTEISPSQFEALAGWSARRQPYWNIYTTSRLTLHDIALSLANGQNLATGSSDDTYAACGARGDLIICDGCPRAFHAVGAEMILASVPYAIHRKHVKKGFTDGVSNDVQWRILSGKSHYPEHLPECFDPIVATSGRDLIPVMVYGRHISEQEFGGMYCVVLIANRSYSFLFVCVDDFFFLSVGLFSCIESPLYSPNVENLVLPAAEEAESIWTKKLGFRKMSDERCQP
ncbi:hypothetical protein ACSBR1_036110 [Camellia fascicularis]